MSIALPKAQVIFILRQAIVASEDSSDLVQFELSLPFLEYASYNWWGALELNLFLCPFATPLSFCYWLGLWCSLFVLPYPLCSVL